MIINFYVSNPRTVKAIHAHSYNLEKVKEFCGESCIIETKDGERTIAILSENNTIQIAYPGDFIVRSNHDSFYVSPEECFRQNYDLTYFSDNTDPVQFRHLEKTVIAFEWEESILDQGASAFIQLVSNVGNRVQYRNGQWMITRPVWEESGVRNPWILQNGDMIVFNGRGFYPVKPDIFHKDYSPMFGGNQNVSEGGII